MADFDSVFEPTFSKADTKIYSYVTIWYMRCKVFLDFNFLMKDITYIDSSSL